MAVAGYARVSTEDQSTEGQILDLKKFGCTEIFRENAFGADRERSARHPYPPASGHDTVPGVSALFTC
jgi:DNA invertase Pin-like site-specific DNA recombinase